MIRMTPLFTNVCKRVMPTKISNTVSSPFCIQTSTTEEIPADWENAKPYQSIPGPKEIPVVGNAWRFLPVIGDLYGLGFIDINHEFHKRYGKIARLSGVPFPDTVMLYSADDIEYFIRNDGAYPERETTTKSFTYYRKYMRTEGLQGLADVQGKEWYKLRSKLNPVAMHPPTILQYVGTIDEIAGDFIAWIRFMANLDPNREMPDDFLKVLYSWTTESIFSICLNKRLGCLDPHLSKDSEQRKLIDAILEMFNLFYKIEFTPTIRNIHKTKTWFRFVEVMDYIMSVFISNIEEAAHKINTSTKIVPDNEATMLQKLLKHDKNTATIATVDFLTGGVDTTGKVLASGLYYLAKYPEAQNKLREEMCRLLPRKDSKLTKETLADAPYLRAVVKETTRIAPIAIGNIRKSTKNIVIRGYQIPKGTNIMSSHFILCRSDEHYVNANDFIPERWLRTTTGELSVKSTNPFVSMPFGFGPRSCLGKRVANLELEIGIGKIVRNFYLEWHHKDISFRADPFYGVAEPLKLRMLEVEE